MSYQDKLGQAKKLYADVRAILDNEESTAEDKGKVERMLADAERLKNEATQLKQILDSGIEEMMAEVEQAPLAGQEQKEGAEKWASFPEFLQAAWKGFNPRFMRVPLDPRLTYFDETRDESITRQATAKDRKVMVENVGASGGFLVPPEYRMELQAAIGEGGIVRPRATVIRMARRQVNMPVLDQTGTTAGRPHWFGGMVFYWAEEASEKTATDAAFREIQLVAHKLIGYTQMSDELVADSAISLEDFFRGPLGYVGGATWTEDYTFLQGTGAGQPLGVINAGATITVARTADNPCIQYTDLVNMLEAFLPNARGVWVITHNAMSNVLLMSGPAGNPSYLWGNAVTGLENTLMGLPVIFTEKLPSACTTGDVLLADFAYYLIGDRQATTIESTQYDQWRYDRTSWRMVHRVDGQPWLSAPLTYQDGATQVSPFVILGEKSS